MAQLDMKEVAAEQLRLTAEKMLSFRLIDGIIEEPDGGAHWIITRQRKL
jgi:acetyl-CoA carboxylase carboxyl transferase subunit alpha